MSEPEAQLSLTRAALSTCERAENQIPTISDRTAVPLDAGFLADCPYQPEALLLDEMVEIDKERSLVRARMSPRPDLPLTCFQRVDPVRHPRHVNGGLLVHLTGMLGFVHAYYVLA
jgi:hypothetical protein